jgi:cytochrome d ubiquinol oxidase subunit II
MHTLWYAIIAVMLSIYVVLDGFDFGAGILHLVIARTDAERQLVFKAIGPFWNGNEVWLISSGGLLVFAFPKVYAAGFSGFYMALMMVLWLFVVRGLSIEFRSKEDNPLWRTFCDTSFSVSSLLLAIVFGAALGNVIRGVPLHEGGYFSGPLFTNFCPGRDPGVLDWYTVSVGVFAALTLAGHGALFLACRTADSVKQRCLSAARIIWPSVLCTGAVVTYLTHLVRPQIYESLIARPWTWLFAFFILASLSVVFFSLRKGKDALAFSGSVCLIIGLLSATASGMYPNMLISTVDPSFTLTADNAGLDTRGLGIGLVWWLPAIVLTTLYFANLFRIFRGRVETADGAYEH